MKIPVLAGGVILLLSFSAVSYAQQERKEEGARPPQQQENKPADVKPADPTPDGPAQEDKRVQEETNNKKSNNDERKNQEKQAKQDKQQKKDELNRADQEQGREQEQVKDQKGQNRASSAGAERDHKQTQRIPDDKFRAHFGREHHFRVSQPVIVENRPRFQYSGYWFEFVDVWPAEWSYSDDCYVDYIDGEYFLFDVLHPGVRIALVVVL